jgi:hypothetical protein
MQLVPEESRGSEEASFKLEEPPGLNSPSKPSSPALDLEAGGAQPACSPAPPVEDGEDGAVRSLRRRWQHLWRGLPTAGKATLVLAVISAILLVTYGVVSVSFRSYDEEAHIATVIIVSC